MTDKEIKKALECCKGGLCCGCPRLSNGRLTGACMRELIPYALDLINRLQSAIDVYMQENDKLKTLYIQVSEDRNEIRKEAEAEIERLERHTEMYHEVRAEAIKEFAERLQYEIDLCDEQGEIFINARSINEVLNEMVGEQE